MKDGRDIESPRCLESSPSFWETLPYFPRPESVVDTFVLYCLAYTSAPSVSPTGPVGTDNTFALRTHVYFFSEPGSHVTDRYETLRSKS